MKESKQKYRKRMYDLWNEMGMFEIMEQNLAWQVWSIFENKRLTEIEIQQLRKEIKKDEIVPDRVDAVSEMSYGGSSGTETFKEQRCDLGDYPGNTPEDDINNPIHQRRREIMHERAKGDIPTLGSRDITFVTKYVHEVN